jgi:hypothetical protein
MKITVTEGGPLPFASDILATSWQYGSVALTKHLSEIPDYFKQSFPEGFTWERTTIYEDGGYLTAQQDTRFVILSIFPSFNQIYIFKNKTLYFSLSL